MAGFGSGRGGAISGLVMGLPPRSRDRLPPRMPHRRLGVITGAEEFFHHPRRTAWRHRGALVSVAPTGGISACCSAPIADDFTGASDLANTLARRGHARRSSSSASGSDAPADCEAGRRGAEDALDPGGGGGRRSVAGGALAARPGLPADPVQILLDLRFDAGGQYRPGRRGAARADRSRRWPSSARPFRRPGGGCSWAISSSATGCSANPGMETHPLTPMTDPDIRRWLRAADEGRGRPGRRSTSVRAGAGAIAAALAARRMPAAGWSSPTRSPTTTSSLSARRSPARRWSPAVRASRSACRRISAPRACSPAIAAELPRSPGPAVVLSGSCSTASRSAGRRPICERAPGLAVDPADADRRHDHGRRAPPTGRTARARRRRRSSIRRPSPQRSRQPQSALRARGGAPRRIEDFFADLARRLAERGVRRIVVGGGETSGAVVEALGVERLRDRRARSIPACRRWSHRRRRTARHWR